jgi:hypothetical protein
LVFHFIGRILGSNRVSPGIELAGLDIPEMGAPGYPEFVSHLGAESIGSAEISSADSQQGY